MLGVPDLAFCAMGAVDLGCYAVDVEVVVGCMASGIGDLDFLAGIVGGIGVCLVVEVGLAAISFGNLGDLSSSKGVGIQAKGHFLVVVLACIAIDAVGDAAKQAAGQVVFKCGIGIGTGIAWVEALSIGVGFGLAAVTLAQVGLGGGWDGKRRYGLAASGSLAGQFVVCLNEVASLVVVEA